MLTSRIVHPRIIHEHSPHPQKVTVLCGMTCERIIGPHFFEDDKRRTATVTRDSFRKCIQEYLLTEMEDPDMHKMWFQQDGACSAHRESDN